jgi:hypothetical protein
MIKPTMASQWDPGNFKPLDMSEISGYPRKMPLRYENWLPRFTNNDGVRVEDHMGNFWDFFQFHNISDDPRKWYDDLPDASITSMDQLEETFLEKWGIKLEDIHMVIKRLEYMKHVKV